MDLNFNISKKGHIGLEGGPNAVPYMQNTYVGISTIHGRGLMANKDLDVNDIIGLAHSNGEPTHDIGEWYNHSEEPNTESIMMLGGQRYLKPLRKLKEGEEITVDYRRQPELEQPDNFFQKAGETGAKKKAPIYDFTKTPEENAARGVNMSGKPVEVKTSNKIAEYDPKTATATEVGDFINKLSRANWEIEKDYIYVPGKRGYEDGRYVHKDEMTAQDWANVNWEKNKNTYGETLSKVGYIPEIIAEIPAQLHRGAKFIGGEWFTDWLKNQKTGSVHWDDELNMFVDDRRPLIPESFWESGVAPFHTPVDEWVDNTLLPKQIFPNQIETGGADAGIISPQQTAELISMAIPMGGAGKANMARQGFRSLADDIANTHKINPWSYQKNLPDNVNWRGIAKEGADDALEYGAFRPRQNVEPQYMGKTGGIDGAKRFDKVYYGPKFKTAEQYGQGFIAEVPKDAAKFNRRYKGKEWSLNTERHIPITEGRILKEHWLRGYKPVKIKPTRENLSRWQMYSKAREEELLQQAQDEIRRQAEFKAMKEAARRKKEVKLLALGIESSDQKFDRVFKNIIDKDSPLLTRNLESAEFADDFSGLKNQNRALGDKNEILGRRTKHFSGAGTGAVWGNPKYNTTFIGNIDDIKSASGSHLRNLQPTDTYFYSSDDVFKLTDKGVYLTSNPETYRKLYAAGKQVKLQPNLFDGSTSKLKGSYFDDRSSILKRFDDYKDKGSMLETTEPGKTFSASFNQSAVHEHDILSHLENPEILPLSSKFMEGSRIGRSLTSGIDDYNFYNQWNRLPKKVRDSELKKIKSFYESNVKTGKLSEHAFDSRYENNLKQYQIDYKKIIDQLEDLHKNAGEGFKYKKGGPWIEERRLPLAQGGGEEPIGPIPAVASTTSVATQPLDLIKPIPRLTNDARSGDLSHRALSDQSLFDAEIWEQQQEKFKKAKRFHWDWMNSDQYKKMLAKSVKKSNGDANDFADIYTKRLANLMNIPGVNVIGRPHEDSSTTSGVSYTGTGVIDIFPYGYNKTTTLPHEVSHAVDRPWHMEGSTENLESQLDYEGLNKMERFALNQKLKSKRSNERLIPQADVDLIRNMVNAELKSRGKEKLDEYEEYVADPTETRARLNVMRQEAAEMGIYDPNNEEFTIDHLYEYRANAPFRKGDPYSQLRGIFNYKQIIELMNSVAQSDSEKEPLNIAKKGGPFGPPEPPPDDEPVNAITSEVLQDALMEQVLSDKRALTDEQIRVNEATKRLLELAQRKDQKNIPTRTDLFWIKKGRYFCNSHTCELMKDAGFTVPESSPGDKRWGPGDSFPLIPGNDKMKGSMQNLGFIPVSESQLRPGDFSQEEIYKNKDYQGNVFPTPRWIPSHSTIYSGSGMYYNAPGGSRYNYEITPYEDLIIPGARMKSWRYVGDIPALEEQLAKSREAARRAPLSKMPTLKPKLVEARSKNGNRKGFTDKEFLENLKKTYRSII